MRPKIEKLLDHALEPVEDRAPKKPFPASLLASLDAQWFDVAHADLGDEISACEIDHTVGPTGLRGGLTSARARLREFLEDGLVDYGERRRDPSDEGGSSRLSAYLHHGHVSAAEVARAVMTRGPKEQSTAFLNEMVVWRELALNFCLRNPAYRGLDALPDWARRSMEKHEEDAREHTYSLDELERAETHDELWNAGQRELVQTGAMHNVVRMLWGKSVLTWTSRYSDALSHLIYLNDRYALDGRDPNSYAGIQWCFGKFDRPFASRPVWGTIRPMSLDRARRKGGMESYVRRWSSQQVEMSLER
jgi:deoxyribodipyrimidine photo-lyase